MAKKSNMLKNPPILDDDWLASRTGQPSKDRRSSKHVLEDRWSLYKYFIRTIYTASIKFTARKPYTHLTATTSRPSPQSPLMR